MCFAKVTLNAKMITSKPWYNDAVAGYKRWHDYAEGLQTPPSEPHYAGTYDPQSYVRSIGLIVNSYKLDILTHSQ